MTESIVRGKGFQHLFYAVPDAMIVADVRGLIVALNPAAERLLGWTEGELTDDHFRRIISQRFRRVAEWQTSEDFNSSDVSRREAAISLFALKKDGSEIPIELHRSPLGPGDPPLVLLTFRDITEWRLRQDSLYREKERAYTTLESMADAVVAADLARTITYLNPVAERLTGWRTSEALGKQLTTVLPLISEVTRQAIEGVPADCIEDGRATDLPDGVLLLRRDGTEVPIGDSAAPLRDRNGAITGVVMVFHDITERRRVTRRLTHQATHDPLTGLINRSEFEQRVGMCLEEAKTYGTDHALCFVDLDRFKIVNDTFGHGAGDEVLKSISDLLVHNIRSGDTVGRLGGDEFGILLKHCSLAKAQKIADTLLQSIKGFSFKWEGESLSFAASVGIAPITSDGGRAADLFRASDSACYMAKNAGGNRIHFNLDMGPGVHERKETRWATRLTRAVDEGRFQLFTQPIVPLAEHVPKRHRCEIFVSLADERRHREATSVFLPAAERYRLMPVIDRWVLNQTVELLSRWYSDHPECSLPVCSINLCVASLHDGDLVAWAREVLVDHNLPPDVLCFEIAEVAAFGNFAQLVRLMADVRATGCGIALDDFGSGLTSFANLRALPVDYVKIGGHYVRSIVDDPVHDKLVGTVQQIGRIMGIPMVANEVETSNVLVHLRSMGVDYAQGHAAGPVTPLVDADGNIGLPCVERSA